MQVQISLIYATKIYIFFEENNLESTILIKARAYLFCNITPEGGFTVISYK